MATKVPYFAQQDEPAPRLQSFWNSFTTQAPGTVSKILTLASTPTDEDVDEVDCRTLQRTDVNSYDDARRACIRRVAIIVRDCKRRNEKFTDPDFDIRRDHTFIAEADQLFLRGLPKPSRGQDDTRSNAGWEKGGWGSRPTNGPELNKADRQLSLGQYQSKVGRDEKIDTLPQSVRRLSSVLDHASFCLGAVSSNLPSERRRSPYIRAMMKELRDLSNSHQAQYWFLELAITTIIQVYCQKGVTVLAIGVLLLLCLGSGTGTIFKRPSRSPFASDVIQQSDHLGNCWWLCAVAVIRNRGELLRKICVAWDQEFCVYGFLFYKDGAWTYTVVDDYVYLSPMDYHKTDEALHYGDRLKERSARYEQAYQRGPSALHFAKCANSNHTWLPLLEKAYAKIHGDYESLVAGWIGDGIEDLTGGITSLIRSDSLADRDVFWSRMRSGVNDDFYALTTPNAGDRAHHHGGLIGRHAYGVEQTYEYWTIVGWKLKQVRLLKIRNPWGSKDGVWQGEWSAGSSQWSLFSSWWLKPDLHQNGVFFMTFEDALRHFRTIEQTRIYDEKLWTSRQLWVKVHVAWVPQYSDIFFRINLSRASEVALVLSQLDYRYFRRLEGRYYYDLEILLRDPDGLRSDYISRARAMNDSIGSPKRSVAIEEHLEAGTYDVLIKVIATARTDNNGVWSVEDTVMQSTDRPAKLQQIARNYDAAHSKLLVIDEWATKAPSTKGCRTDATNGHMYSDPNDVAWNAVCGVGLRVYSKDPDMRLDLHHRTEQVPLDHPGKQPSDISNKSDAWKSRLSVSDYGWGDNRSVSNDGWGSKRELGPRDCEVVYRDSPNSRRASSKVDSVLDAAWDVAPRRIIQNDTCSEKVLSWIHGTPEVDCGEEDIAQRKLGGLQVLDENAGNGGPLDIENLFV